MFEKDENEDDSPPNLASFLDDLHPRVGLENIFGHGLDSQDRCETLLCHRDEGFEHADIPIVKPANSQLRSFILKCRQGNGDDNDTSEMKEGGQDDVTATSERTDGTGSSLGESE